MAPPSTTPAPATSPQDRHAAAAAYRFFVRQLVRRWTLIIPALVMVCISSLTLGVGMLGASPILDNVLGAKKDLPAFASEFNATLAGWADQSRWGRLAAEVLTLSPATIDALPPGPLTALWWIMGAIAVLTVLGSTTNFLHAYLSLTAVNLTATRARAQAFRSALRAPLGTITRLGPSDVVSRIVNDSVQLANGLNVLLSKAVLQVVKGVAALAVALVFDWRVTVAALLVTPILYTIIRKLGKRIRRASGRALESQAGLYGVAGEALGALRVVKVNTGEAERQGAFARRNRDMLRETNRVRTARALASPLTEMLSVFLLCGLVLAAGNAVVRGQVNPKDFLLVLAALGVAGASLKPLTGIINDIHVAAPAAWRRKRIIDLAPEPGHARRLSRSRRTARASPSSRCRSPTPGTPCRRSTA